MQRQVISPLCSHVQVTASHIPSIGMVWVSPAWHSAIEVLHTIDQNCELPYSTPSIYRHQPEHTPCHSTPHMPANGHIMVRRIAHVSSTCAMVAQHPHYFWRHHGGAVRVLPSCYQQFELPIRVSTTGNVGAGDLRLDPLMYQALDSSIWQDFRRT